MAYRSIFVHRDKDTHGGLYQDGLQVEGSKRPHTRYYVTHCSTNYWLRHRNDLLAIGLREEVDTRVY